MTITRTTITMLIALTLIAATTQVAEAKARPIGTHAKPAKVEKPKPPRKPISGKRLQQITGFKPCTCKRRK